MNESVRLGKEIRRVRRNYGLTESEAGALVGISATYWKKLEKGTSMPTVDVAVRIMKILGISPKVFFEGIDTFTLEELDSAIEKCLKKISSAVPGINSKSLIEYGKSLNYRLKKRFLKSLTSR